MKLPKKFTERVSQSLKTYQAIALAHRTRDVSEADTVTVVKDILSDIFGYDKYTELTSEQQIRGTFCDLAVKIDGKIRFLIEVKAAAIDLNDSHLRQAVNYGAHQGIEWIVLTNSIEWKLYRVKFGQPIDQEEVSCFSLANVNSKKDDDLNRLFLLSREGFVADAVTVYHQQAQVLNKFTIAQILMSVSAAKFIKKEMRRLFPDIKVDEENISDLLVNDILKREVLEGDKVKEAQQRIKRIEQKIARQTTPTKEGETSVEPIKGITLDKAVA